VNFSTAEERVCFYSHLIFSQSKLAARYAFIFQLSAARPQQAAPQSGQKAWHECGGRNHEALFLSGEGMPCLAWVAGHLPLNMWKNQKKRMDTD
jgi:hypothetical protein